MSWVESHPVVWVLNSRFACARPPCTIAHFAASFAYTGMSGDICAVADFLADFAAYVT